MSAHCEKHGIRHQRSIAYISSQNGVAERRNRILLDATRPLLIAANAPHEYWHFAMSTANHTLNRSYNRITAKGSSPFEAWHGNKPDLKNFRIWGCKAIVHIPLKTPAHHKLKRDHLQKTYYYKRLQTVWKIQFPFSTETLLNPRGDSEEESIHELEDPMDLEIPEPNRNPKRMYEEKEKTAEKTEESEQAKDLEKESETAKESTFKKESETAKESIIEESTIEMPALPKTEEIDKLSLLAILEYAYPARNHNDPTS